MIAFSLGLLVGVIGCPIIFFVLLHWFFKKTVDDAIKKDIELSDIES